VALVLCLGNPGERYARTRHNAGWQVLDEFRHRLDAREGARDPAYREWVAELRGRPVTLVQPLTFMNLSGEALVAWRARHPEDASQLLVVTDDVYLPVGWLRIRARGSSGGHRGLESIERVLGIADYARLRVGVGAVEQGELKQYVLDEPAAAEAGAMAEAIRVAVDAVECWLEEGILVAMNRFNRKVPREATES
jgi:PTH1 family peptidyl-tRNA hydrolase